ncbi:DUF1294 domain-containing protein [Luteimonas sp. WGS1318]|uniref:DUF1294 domain-containing protein n=1 Tax=Luteimonas sp. WGS1318 TaxID=3366815 RepID=UPI00372CF343
MRLGKVVEWHETRGFGFVAPIEQADSPARLFFHIRDYTQAGRRPEPGELVRFTAHRQNDGRWCARAVTRTTPPAAGASRGRAATPSTGLSRHGPAAAGVAVLLLVLWLALLVYPVRTGQLPAWTPIAALGLNLATFVLYGVDKHAARNRRRRTPESHLHLLELLGGWPAAWLAQRLLRHKSAKPAYRTVYRRMVALHLVTLAIWIAAGSRPFQGVS